MQCVIKLADHERQARSRKARAEAGGKQIAVMLTPKAAEKLAGHVAKGETIAQVVNRLLVKSRL
jgi:hypothetical protein